MQLVRLFAKNMREVRRRKKLSQGQVADRAGMTVSYVSMLERGLRSPPLDTIELVGKALGVSPVSLLQR